jgi:predicted AlkP superfamily phosphohydrolase/phosphomutase/tetratricopeptide (TPR) repeat protein
MKRTMLLAGALVLTVGLFLGASLTRVTPQERAFRLSRFGSEVVKLEVGAHVVPPYIFHLVRLPIGPARAKGTTPVRSREGSELVAGYELEANLPDEAFARWLTDPSRRGVDPQKVLVDEAMTALVEWGRTASGEEMALGTGREAAEQRVRTALQAQGFESVKVSLAGAAGSPEVAATLGAKALRDRAQATGTRVAILGLDGADWEILDPLIKQGKMPNLARLKAKGAWGPMKSMDPMLSPLLWTSVATGRTADVHGVIDFLVRDSAGKAVPVSSRARRVKALWNMAGDGGRNVGFVAWWATWPAEEVNGTLVSDRVAYSTFEFTSGMKGSAGATWPASFMDELRPHLVDAESIKDADLRRFANGTPEEFRRLAKIVAAARSYEAAGLDILARGQPDLFSVYFQGIDEVCHRFAHYMPPKMKMVTQEDYQRYQGTVEAYYIFQDELLGKILSRLAPDTTILVLSDHGFRNGTGRPPDDPPYVEGKPGLWHRRYGIFIMAGPTVRQGTLDTTSLLDIAPTTLYLLGLPKGEDMPGRVIEAAIAPAFLQRFPRRTVPSYEAIGRPVGSGTDLVADAAVEQEMMDQLHSLGYISSGDGAASGVTAGAGAANGGTLPGQRSAGPTAAGGAGADSLGGGALITAHVNEANLALKNKDYARAEASVQRALKMKPDFIPALILEAQIAREQKNFDRAIATSKKILELAPREERQNYAQVARLYDEAGRQKEGLQFLRGVVAANPDVAEARAALGSLLLKSGDRGAAEKELLESLRLDPALPDPLTELHTLYQGTDRILSLEGIVRKGLELNEQSVVHHNWMGLIYEWKHDAPHAEQEFRRAMELDPDYAATMANLGAMYGRSGRLPEAVAILERAVAKDPDNLEAWVNLGAARGRLNQPKEAIQALETARGKGAKSTTLYNALALAYLQDRQKDKALAYLDQSLVIDPGQKEAQELKKMVQGSR